MSDSEGDIDDMILELAGGGASSDKRRRKRQSDSAPKASKRRRHDLSDDSDAQADGDGDASVADPYPLEGKYKDEDDREQLMDMNEIEREEILAQRLEEMQRLQDQRSLDQLVRMQRGGAPAADDSISKSAKRQHAVRGATKEKTRKLDELKARRKAKDEKKRPSPGPDRESSPEDMDMSSGEEEDGQVTKQDEAEARERRLLEQTRPDKDRDPLTLADLMPCWLDRVQVAKFYMTPWFEEYVQGMFVRYLLPPSKPGEPPVYRVCEVENVGKDLVRPYTVDGVTVHHTLELRHGSAVKPWPMDRISNAPITDSEFDSWKRRCQHDQARLPSRRTLDTKTAQLTKLRTQTMTEEHVEQILEKKRSLAAPGGDGGGVGRTAVSLSVERARLQQARALAVRRHDSAEVATLDAKLAALPGGSEPAAARPASAGSAEDVRDRLERVNERNRRQNLEAVRRAEIADAERKRARRKLEAAEGGTPGGTRPGTPLNGGGTQAPADVPASALVGAADPAKGVTAFEASLLEDVEIDLGDF